MRAASLAPILPQVMEEGERKKAALILMKNYHFDRTPQYLECPDLIVNSKSSVALDDDSRHKRRLARRHKKALLNNSKIQMLPGLATNSIVFCFLFVKNHQFAWRANH